MNSFINKRPLLAEQNELLGRIKREVSGKNIKTVSFKMNDVLVVTPFSAVRDIFMFMENDFRKVSKSRKSFAELRT
ncbi:MAG: hypothetical protein K2F73_01150, partial [Ruminococcus sp.]|nr:hypothetical protein [Ruminococcus sp.]